MYICTYTATATNNFTNSTNLVIVNNTYYYVHLDKKFVKSTNIQSIYRSIFKNGHIGYTNFVQMYVTGRSGRNRSSQVYMYINS